MQASPKPASRTRALIGLTLLVCLLLFLLALIEGPDSKLGCSPIAPASANTLEPAPLDPPPSDLDDPGQGTAALPQAHVPAPPMQKLRGRVADEATDEPIPWVFVRISSPAGNVTVSTNADGSFVTDLVVASGNLDAEVTDDGQPVGTAHAQWPHANDANGWTIHVPIGPTFPIASMDGSAPRESARWRLRLVESQNPIGTAGTISVSADKLEAQNKGDLRDWGWKSLRNDGDRPFVRWPKRAFQASPEWLPSMSVRSDPTTAKAIVSVYGTVGIQPALSITTTPFALLIGSVTVPNGTSPAGTHVVACDPIDEAKKTFDAVPFFAEIETKEDGGYSFEVPAFLTYNITAWRRSLTMMDAQAIVHRGRTFGPDLQLLAPTEPITGTQANLHFADRAENFGSLLRMVPTAVTPFTDALLFDSTRRDVGLFDLAVGPYVVESVGVDHPPHLSTVRRRQKMPIHELDSPPSFTPSASMHRIEASNAGGSMRCVLSAGPSGSIFTTTRQGSTFAWMVPPDNPAVFTAWCTGYSPALITEDRFEKRDGELVATTVLSPGWGALLAFRAGDPDDKKNPRGSRNPPGNITSTDALGFIVPPLPGVRVNYRGAKLGSSDRDGCLLVSMMVRPEKLTLVAPGWHMTGTTRMPGAGSRWWVWMQRDP